MSEKNKLQNVRVYNNVEETLVLFEDDRVRIERIYSNGWVQPKRESFISDIDEFVTLEKGTAEISMDGGEKVFLKAGDSY